MIVSVSIGEEKRTGKQIQVKEGMRHGRVIWEVILVGCNILK